MEPNSPFDRERPRLLRSVYGRLEEIQPSPSATMTALRLLDEIVADWQPTPWVSVDAPKSGAVSVHWRVKKDTITIAIAEDGTWSLWRQPPVGMGSREDIAEGGPDGIIDPAVVTRLHELFVGMGKKVADLSVGWGPAG